MSVKFSIIGFGHIGRRHATIANEYSNSKVVAVVDVNPITKNHELFPENASFFDSIDAFLDAKIECDVVNIATPNGFHCSYAIKCLKAGYHVVIEKPMGLSAAECEEVIHTSLLSTRQKFTTH